MTDISWKERLKFTLIGLLIIGIFILGVLEFKWLQNTLNARNLLYLFAGIGAVMGSVIGYTFAKKTKDDVEKMQFFLIFISIGFFFLPIFGSVSNRLLTFAEYENREVELFDQKGFIADLGIMKGDSRKADGYFTFVIIDEKLERFKSKKPLFPNAKNGDKVNLQMKKGLYGFWVVNIN